MLVNCLIIGTGGFCGAILRYLCSGWVQTLTKGHAFPWGTLVVNLVGCLLIGCLSQAAELRQIFSEQIRNLLFMGFLGAFTTFSTFGNETAGLLRQGEGLFAFWNIILHITLGLATVFLGRYLTTLVIK